MVAGHHRVIQGTSNEATEVIKENFDWSIEFEIQHGLQVIYLIIQTMSYPKFCWRYDDWTQCCLVKNQSSVLFPHCPQSCVTVGLHMDFFSFFFHTSNWAKMTFVFMVGGNCTLDHGSCAECRTHGLQYSPPPHTPPPPNADANEGCLCFQLEVWRQRSKTKKSIWRPMVPPLGTVGKKSTTLR